MNEHNPPGAYGWGESPDLEDRYIQTLLIAVLEKQFGTTYVMPPALCPVVPLLDIDPEIKN